MKNSFLIIYFITSTHFASAQKDAAKIHTLNICNVTLSRGATQHFTKSISFNDFLHLMPGSDLLKRTYTDFDEYNGGNYGTSTFLFSAGFQFANKQKPAYRNTPLLRIGIKYHSSNGFNSGLDLETFNNYDFLYSMQTGIYVGFDSVYRKGVNIDYRYDQLLIDGSMLLRSNPHKQIAVCTGLGVTAGTSVSTTLNIHYGESTHTEVWFPEESGFYKEINYNFQYGNDAYEDFNLRKNKSIGAYIPVVLDFKLAKKKKYWNLIHFVFEARGGMNMLQVSRQLIRSGFQLDGTMGIKVEW